MKPIRVFIADDHTMMLDGLKAMVSSEPDFELAGAASNGQEVLGLLPLAQADVLLLDLEMPRMNGLDTLVRLQAEHPNLRVLILSMHYNDTIVERVQASGAQGYVLKLESKTTLVRAIHQVAKGGTYFFAESPGSNSINRPTNASNNSALLEGLSTREIEVLQLIAEGLSSAEIGAQLKLSDRTVDGYRNRLLEKLDARNKAGLIKVAFKAGLIR